MFRTQRDPALGTPEFWTGVLNLDGYEVVHHQHDPEENVWQFTVIPQICAAVCPHCHRPTDEVHQRRDRQHIHDLPIGDARVELTVRTFQFRCDDCGKCFTPSCPILAEGAHATERFLDRCAELIRTGDVVNAAAFFGIPEKTLEGWYYEHLQRRQATSSNEASPVCSLGIDELALKKGIGDTSP